MVMLSLDRVKQFLHYDPATGVFVWKVSRGKVAAGTVAGCLGGGNRGSQYRLIGIDGKLHKAHRLAWLYVTGEWPTEFVDHINGDTTDNRFANLRQASNAENGFNRRAMNRNNTSGFRGVVWIRKRRRWLARIKVDGRYVYLGSFVNKDDAIDARLAGERKYFGGFAPTF